MIAIKCNTFCGFNREKKYEKNSYQSRLHDKKYFWAQGRGGEKETGIGQDSFYSGGKLGVVVCETQFTTHAHEVNI